MTIGSKIIGFVAMLLSEANLLHKSIIASKACLPSSLVNALLKPLQVLISNSKAKRYAGTVLPKLANFQTTPTITEITIKRNRSNDFSNKWRGR
jgi:hypothetical protein